ncbi:MAG TPA: response regulator [Candidatus Limnocylindrales bacterium]|nr:response regulator [Candidatus Limnocylindrales bacterium]
MSQSPKTVLLVDDEPSVLTVVETVLNRAGYRTIATSDSRHALSLSADADVRVDLLLTDLAMPDIDGIQLAQEFRLNSPGTKVLYMTGHPSRVAMEQGLPAFADLMNKPFRPRDLLERVERALALRATATAF